MGWCSATEIMDMAVSGAETAFDTLLRAIQEDPGKGRATAEWDKQELLDAALRPFVATIAEKLRDSDWDCIDEADAFDRFPQEMLGYDDRRYLEHLHELLKWTEPGEHNYPTLIRKVAAMTAKMEGNANGAG